MRVRAEEDAGADEVEGSDGVDVAGETGAEAGADTGADVEADGRDASAGAGE